SHLDKLRLCHWIALTDCDRRYHHSPRILDQSMFAQTPPHTIVVYKRKLSAGPFQMFSIFSASHARPATNTRCQCVCVCVCCCAIALRCPLPPPRPDARLRLCFQLLLLLANRG